MYYRRQGEPQEMYGNNSVSSSAVNTYQPYYKEDFNILDPALSDHKDILFMPLLLLFFCYCSGSCIRNMDTKLVEKVV